MVQRGFKFEQASNMRHQSGFTMIEMIAVLTISILIMGIAGPPLVRIHTRAQLRQAVDAMAAGHSLARATAIQNARVAEFRIDPSSDRHWVQVDTGGSSGAIPVGPIVRLRRGDLTSNRTLLCFDARGMPTSAGACEPPDAMVVFSLSGLRDTLRITGLGRIVR